MTSFFVQTTCTGPFLTFHPIATYEAEVESFMKLVQQLMEKKHPTLEHICNCDRTDLNYTMLPGKTLAAKGESMA